MTAKLPILNPEEYDLWLMRIEHYFLMTDYSLWEVIKNGNKVLTKPIGLSEQTYEPTTAEEKQDRRNEMKARGNLLMVLPNKDQLKFHSYQDAKLLMEAIEKRYVGNKESKKGEVIQQENMNLKLLTSLPSEWKTRALIWRNKAKLETISMDDLYNNLKKYKPEISRSPNTNQNPQNMAFVSLNSTSNTNEADTTASGVSTSHTQVETPTENALIAQDGIGGCDWSYQTKEETPTNYAFMAFTSSGSSFSFESEWGSQTKTYGIDGLCIKLSDRVLDLEKTKTAQAKEIANLKKKVKKLERKRRSKTLGMNLFKIGTSRKRSLGKDDASKHRRNLKQRVMSSPNHPTFDIEDAFSSTNTPDYTLTSPNYFPASPGNTSSDSLNNSSGLVPIASPTLSLFHDDPYMKVMHAYDAIIPPQVPILPLTIMPPSLMFSPIFNPQEFFLPEELLPPKKQSRER
uniref:Ribonuclease H-like domain-containing protein n=1 Tax=Tanacetum cinerariifolium TaxID=118510 RepID=A0A6L2J8V1_TANCI|nr:ribonuclease H-like domain-containing protein [Tanacetum cinerariifolium]